MNIYYPRRAVSGPVGPQGPSGLQGPTGLQGPSGLQGITGVQGAQGVTGIQGAQGIQGVTGIQGPQGSQGASGIAGPTGLQGASGIQGPTGIQGASGSVGGTGLQGPTGIQGPSGLQGAQGPAGTGGVSSFLQLSDISYSTLHIGQQLFYNGNNSFAIRHNYGGVVNVKDFGASGDGSTDDRLSIQRAAESINNGTGVTLYFPYSTGRYIIRVDADPSNFLFNGMNNSYPLIKLTRRGTTVKLENGAHIDVVANFSLSGIDSTSIQKAPLFGIYARDCTIDGGKYTLSTGNSIIYQGSGVNGYPIYYSISHNTTWNNIIFSGFAGESLNSGEFVSITGDFEYIDASRFHSCKFYDWGGGWNDGLIRHQSSVLFDNCQFIHRDTTGVVGTMKEHGSALIVRSLITDAKYHQCTFKNIGGGLGNLGHPIDIYTTGHVANTYRARGISILRCNFINNRKLIPILGKTLSPQLSDNKFIYDVTGVQITNLLNNTWNNGWYVSGSAFININNQNNIHISIDSCNIGIISDNTNCKITSLYSSGVIISNNSVRENRYFSDLGYPAQDVNITVDNCNDCLVSDNKFKYDTNTGILATNSIYASKQREVLGNLFSYNRFTSTINFASGYPIYVSRSTRNSYTSNYFIQTGAISNHSIYINNNQSLSVVPYGYSGNWVNLFKGNIFNTPNATGGLGAIFINDSSIKNLIHLNLERGLKAANLINSTGANKIIFNVFNISGKVGTGSYSMDQYNITGSF